MDQDKKLSKKELKVLRRLAELEEKTSEKKQNTIKWIIISISALLFLGLFSFLLISSKQNSANPTEIITISENGWIRGEKSAKVTLAEFSDFQCPACKAYEPIVQQLLKDYDGKLRVLYKHFPLKQAHPNGVPAAKAAEAAGKQSKFWEMHDILFEKQDEWASLPNPEEKFLSYAKGLNLDEDKFTTDYQLTELENKINSEQEEGIKIGVSATPTFYVNGKIVKSGSQISDIKKLIDQELSKDDK